LNFARPSKLRTLLVLGRVSNLPTIWSNCLAGWWLAGAGHWGRLLMLCAFVSFIYIGGMFLNDAFDAGFDRSHRRNRPIPSGAIDEKEVWRWGWAWLITGAAGLVWISRTTALLTLILSACILLYNALHKMVVIAPLLMGACRLLVYLVAASVTAIGITGYCVWAGLALAIYVVGLSFLARKESLRAPVNYWPAFLLGGPLLLALLVDNGPKQSDGCTLSVMLGVWILWALRYTFGAEHPNLGLTVSRLLAGIALVDMLAVADLGTPWIGFFVLWFVLALLFQRFIPAT
jgi:4-hydroxybenzoate polyprenyltransferase